MDAQHQPPTRIASFDVGIRNLAVAVFDVIDPGTGPCDYPARLRYWELIDIYSDMPHGAPAMDCVVPALLRREALFEGVSDVLIEDQGIARPPIQCVGAAIRATYDMHARQSCPGTMRVHSVAPVHKLKAYKGPPLEEGEKTAARTSYTRNKRKAEQHTLAILEAMGATFAHQFLQSHRKRDDLCDAFLQGVWGTQNPALLVKRPILEGVQPMPHTLAFSASK